MRNGNRTMIMGSSPFLDFWFRDLTLNILLQTMLVSIHVHSITEGKIGFHRSAQIFFQFCTILICLQLCSLYRRLLDSLTSIDGKPGYIVFPNSKIATSLRIERNVVVEKTYIERKAQTTTYDGGLGNYPFYNNHNGVTTEAMAPIRSENNAPLYLYAPPGEIVTIEFEQLDQNKQLCICVDPSPSHGGYIGDCLA